MSSTGYLVWLHPARSFRLCTAITSINYISPLVSLSLDRILEQFSECQLPYARRFGTAWSMVHLKCWMRRFLSRNPCRSVLFSKQCLYHAIIAMILPGLSWFLPSQRVCRKRHKCQRKVLPFAVQCLDFSKSVLESKYYEVQMPTLLWLVLEALHSNYAKQYACLFPPPSLTFSDHYQCSNSSQT